MASYFSGPNNVKHQVPSYALINLSTLSNLIRNGFGTMKVLYKI